MKAGDLQIVEQLQEHVQRESWDVQFAAKSVQTRAAGALVTGEGPSVEVARISVPDKMARSWVVTLAPLTVEGRQQPRQVSTGFDPQLISDAFAVVEWGMMASTSWAVIDWTPGQQFTVFGSYVRVWGGVVAFGTAGLNPNPITRFAAHIVPGESTTRPSRTIIYGTTLAAGTTRFRVPAFARTVVASHTNITDAPLIGTALVGEAAVGIPAWVAQPWLERTTDAAGVLTGFRIISPPRPVEIPIGTNFVSFVNSAAVAFAGTRLRYELAMS